MFVKNAAFQFQQLRIKKMQEAAEQVIIDTSWYNSEKKT